MKEKILHCTRICIYQKNNKNILFCIDNLHRGLKYLTISHSTHMYISVDTMKQIHTYTHVLYLAHIYQRVLLPSSSEGGRIYIDNS